MIRSCVFVSWAITLFLSGCLCADAATAANSKDKAVQDVKALKELTAGVLSRAESNSREAESTKSTVEEQKDKAVNAESDVRTAAAEIKAVNRKVQAAGVVQKATEELGTCNTLYAEAKKEAETASASLNGFVQRAKDLVQSAEIEIPDALTPPDDYTTVIRNAAAVTDKTNTLSEEIQKSTDLTTAKIALLSLRKGAQKVQVLKYQAESLVIVSNIEAKMSEAETDIQSIEEKKKEINTIVQGMKTKFQSASGTSTSVLSSLCSNAESQLGIATKKVQEANKCNTDIQEKKTQLDETLATLMARTGEETEAGGDAKTVKWHEEQINVEIAKIKAALGAAETSLSNAKSRQQQMQDEMSPKNSQLGGGLNNEKPNDKVPTEEVRNPIRNAEQNEPVIPSAEKPTVVKTDEPEITDTDKKEKTDKDKQEITETAKPTGSKTDGPEITDTEKRQITETHKPEITETDKPILGKSEDTMVETSDQPVDANLDNTEENKSTQLAHEEEQNPKDGNSELLNNDKLRKITKDITNNPLIGGEIPTRSAANDSAVTVFIPLLVILVISAVLH